MANSIKSTYETTGICARVIEIEVEDGLIKNVSFTGGCNGNLQGIARLVTGMSVEETIKRLEGVICGHKETSCPDQLAKALKALE